MAAQQTDQRANPKSCTLSRHAHPGVQGGLSSWIRGCAAPSTWHRHQHPISCLLSRQAHRDLRGGRHGGAVAAQHLVPQAGLAPEDVVALRRWEGSTPQGLGCPRGCGSAGGDVAGSGGGCSCPVRHAVRIAHSTATCACRHSLCACARRAIMLVLQCKLQCVDCCAQSRGASVVPFSAEQSCRAGQAALGAADRQAAILGFAQQTFRALRRGAQSLPGSNVSARPAP